METKVIKNFDIKNCPKKSLNPRHYKTNGSCFCFDDVAGLVKEIEDRIALERERIAVLKKFRDYYRSVI